MPKHCKRFRTAKAVCQKVFQQSKPGGFIAPSGAVAPTTRQIRPCLGECKRKVKKDAGR